MNSLPRMLRVIPSPAYTKKSKPKFNSYNRNHNGYCADRNCWAEILYCSYSAFATVLPLTVPPSLDRNHYSAKPV